MRMTSCGASCAMSPIAKALGVDSARGSEVESPTQQTQMDLHRGKRSWQGTCRRRVLSFGQVVQIRFTTGLAMLLPSWIVAVAKAGSRIMGPSALQPIMAPPSAPFPIDLAGARSKSQKCFSNSPGTACLGSFVRRLRETLRPSFRGVPCNRHEFVFNGPRVSTTQ